MPTNDLSGIQGSPEYVATKEYYDTNYAKQQDFLSKCLEFSLFGIGAGMGGFYLLAVDVYNWVKNKYDGTPFPQGIYQGDAPTVRFQTGYLRPNQNSYINQPYNFEARIQIENIHPEEGDRDYNNYLYYNKWLYPKLVNFSFYYTKGQVGEKGKYRKKKKRHDNDNDDQNRDNNDPGDGGNGGAGGGIPSPSGTPFPPAPPPLPLDEEEEEIIADAIENIEDNQGDRINDKKPPLDQLFKDWWRRATDNATSSLHQAQARVGQILTRSTRTIGTRTTTNPLFQK